MENSPNSAGFSDRDHAVLKIFSNDVCRDIERCPAPMAVETVLEQLMKNMALDVQVLTGFCSAELLVPEEGPSELAPATMTLPFGATAEEAFALASRLDTDYRMGGDRSKLSETYRAQFCSCIPYICKNLYQYFGEDSAKFVSYILLAYSEGNDADVLKEAVSIKSISHFSDEQHVTQVKQIMSHIDESDVDENELVAALSQFAGFESGFKFSAKNRNFIETMDVWMRFFVQSEDARRRTAILFGNYRYATYAGLSEAIVRQGYRTLLAMDDVDDPDYWNSVKTRLERVALKKQKEVLQRTEMETAIAELEESVQSDVNQDVETTDADDQPKEPEPEQGILETSELLQIVQKMNAAMSDIRSKIDEMPFTFTPEARHKFDVLSAVGCLSAEEYMLWVKASAYEKDSETQTDQRKKLRDVVDVAGFRQEFERLNRQHSYNVLAAKERELAARVFAEVKRFPYVYLEEEGENEGALSFRAGNPAFVAKNRELTCFTGPWLMASLLLEAGIPYSNLYFVSANEGGTQEPRAATHAALLMMMCDGTSMFLDYGYHSCGRHFSLSVLERGTAKNRLRRLFEQSDASRKDGKKIYGDPVHVKVDPDLASKLGIYSDMHIVPLDQGFAATSLLHTGIELQEAGKTDEAMVAFELGLTSFPTNPDLLARIAGLEIENENYVRASDYLLRAIAECDGHLLARYLTGILLEKAGDSIGAEKFFALVGNDARHEWGDMSFKDWSLRYSNAHRTMRYLQGEKSKLEAQNAVGSLLTPIEDYLL